MRLKAAKTRHILKLKHLNTRIMQPVCLLHVAQRLKKPNLRAKARILATVFHTALPAMLCFIAEKMYTLWAAAILLAKKGYFWHDLQKV